MSSLTTTDTASRATTIVAVGIVFVTLAIITVVLRLVSRAVFLKNAGRDEVAIVISMVSSNFTRFADHQFNFFQLGFVHWIICWDNVWCVPKFSSIDPAHDNTEIKHGLGKHFSAVTPQDFTKLLKVSAHLSGKPISFR
jgi:hypothetical protein